MNRLLPALVLCAAATAADPGLPETRWIGLAEAVRLGMRESPRVRLARLGIEQAGVERFVERSKRSTRLSAGSGLGATRGMPQSVQGASPSVALLTLRQPLIDKRQSRQVDALGAQLRSAEHGASAAEEESGYRAGLLYLDLELARREIERLSQEADSLERIEGWARARVEEGVEIPLALSRARLAVARAKVRRAAAQDRSELLETELRAALGVGPGVRLAPLQESSGGAGQLRDALLQEESRSAAQHPEIFALDAQVDAARRRVDAARSARLPRLDMIGQYSLLARFNNYDDYFRRFERHNWQVGVAVELPLFSGRAVAAQVARATIEERELALRKEVRQTELELAIESAAAALAAARQEADLAVMELAVAREGLDVLLARYEEGQITLADLERARIDESAAWSAWLASRIGLAKAQLGVVYSRGKIRNAFGD